MDHYVKFQENSVNWSGLLSSIPIVLLLTFVIYLMLQSALNKDNEVLDYLR
jgi:hypothetical protein